LELSLESGGMFRFVVAVDEVVGGVGWVCVMVDILGMLMGHCGLYLPVSFLSEEDGGWSSDGEVLTFFLLTRSA
jgi:hypothetical protein